MPQSHGGLHTSEERRAFAEGMRFAATLGGSHDGVAIRAMADAVEAGWTP